MLRLAGQGKQIDQHLEAFALQKIGVVKILPAGFVVDDAKIGFSGSSGIEIHAVHDAAKTSADDLSCDRDRGRILKRKLKRGRNELGLAHFRIEVAHNLKNLPEVAAEQVCSALRPQFKPLETLVHEAVTELLRNLQRVLQRHVPEAALMLHRLDCALQDVMHEHAV